MHAEVSSETEATPTNDNSEPTSAAQSAACLGSAAIEADEVLVLDSSSFIWEIGLMPKGGSALKHYLLRRGTQLVVPQAAAEEYERNLAKVANERALRAQTEMRWLASYFRHLPNGRLPSALLLKIGPGRLSRATMLGRSFCPNPTIALHGQISGTRLASHRLTTARTDWGTAESGNSAWTCCRTMTSYSLHRTRTFSTTCRFTRNCVMKQTRLVPAEA